MFGNNRLDLREKLRCLLCGGFQQVLLRLLIQEDRTGWNMYHEWGRQEMHTEF
jgi:hypothetical protein